MFSLSRSASSLPTIRELEILGPQENAREKCIKALKIKKEADNLYIKKLTPVLERSRLSSEKAEVANTFVKDMMWELNKNRLSADQKEMALHAVKYLGKEMLRAHKQNPDCVDIDYIKEISQKITKLIVALVNDKFKTKSKPQHVPEE